MQNLFGASTEPSGFRGYNPLPQNIRKADPDLVSSPERRCHHNVGYGNPTYRGPTLKTADVDPDRISITTTTTASLALR